MCQESGAIDFWTDSSRREAFGVFVMDVLAEKFHLKDGRSLFMSRETSERVKLKLHSVSAYSNMFAIFMMSVTNDFSHSKSICTPSISVKVQSR